MARRPTVSPREQEVIDRPDGFIVRVMVNGGWEESPVFDAAKAYKAKCNIIELRKTDGSQRYRTVMIHAVRVINDELRTAFVSDAFVYAFADLGYNGNK